MLTATSKGPFIATQLNSTRRRVEFSWVELRRYRHPHGRNSTVAGDRQCNWPSCSVQPISAKQVSRVELSCVGINGPLSHKRNEPVLLVIIAIKSGTTVFKSINLKFKKNTTNEFIYYLFIHSFLCIYVIILFIYPLLATMCLRIYCPLLACLRSIIDLFIYVFITFFIFQCV